MIGKAAVVFVAVLLCLDQSETTSTGLEIYKREPAQNDTSGIKESVPRSKQVGHFSSYEEMSLGPDVNYNSQKMIYHGFLLQSR